MSNGKLGSSSYEAGDTGGACGDYEHGVSSAWIQKMQKRGMKKASKQRIARHAENLGRTAYFAEWRRGSTRNPKREKRFALHHNKVQAAADRALAAKGA